MSKPVYKLIDCKGRIYLPRELRDSLDVGCGDFVKLLPSGNSVQIKKVHLIEVGDHSKEAVEAFVAAAAVTMPKERQLELVSRLLAQLRKEAAR